MEIFSKYLASFILCFFSIAASAQSPPRDLNYFLEHAHTSSPVLKDLANQQKSAGIDSLIIKATAYPQLSANGAGLYAPVVQGYGYDEVITNGQSLEAYLKLNYDLLNKKRTINQLEGIKLQSDSIKYATKLSLLNLDRSITDQYLLAYASQEQVAFNMEVLALLEKEEVLLKQLTQRNVYKQADYLTFLVSLQQQQLTTQQAELQHQNDYATLAYLSGTQDTSKTKLIAPSLASIPMPSGVSFFSEKFEIDSLKNENLKKRIDLNYKPKLGVYANGGYTSSLTLQPYKNFGASAGFTFMVPIYDAHQRKMQHDKFAILNNTVANYHRFFTSQKTQQLNLITQQIAQTDALFGKINKQIKFSKTLIEVNSKLLQTGDLRIADFIIAINNYMSAQNLYRQTTINRLKLINQYNYWNK